MADYIDREELIDKIYELMNPDSSDVVQQIYAQPSVDVVEVVRCKDCINYGMKCCQKDKYFVSVKEEDFCSSGVKKNE